jgi:TQXA domain-containing protein/LPXTG-motif cell wall-anchored protein
MSMLTRTKTKVAGLVTMAAGLITATAGFLAPVAQADNAKATVAGVAPGMNIPIVDDANIQFAAPIFLKIDGKTYASYCIDFYSPLDWGQPLDYIERDWSASPVPVANLGKVQWLLHNAYPSQTIATLAGVSGTADLTEYQAQAATQAAIWKLTDNRDVDRARATRPEDAGFLKLYDYFLGRLADPATALPAPKAVTVNIVESELSGAVDSIVGPFSLETTASQVTLSAPAGVAFFATNDPAANAPITTAKNADKFFVKLPVGTPAGSVTITATAKEPVQAGRLFVNSGNPNSSQKLILAAATDALTTSDTAKVTVADGPKPSASVSNACADGGVEVTMANTGKADANFEIKGRDGTPLAPATKVAPGGSTKVIVPITGSSYDFDVIAGAQVFKMAGARACGAPKLSGALQPDCAAGGVMVTLRNDGDAPGVVQITNGGKAAGDPISVPAKGQVQRLVPVKAGDNYDIAASSGGKDLLGGAAKGTLNCGTPDPKASVVKDCAAGGLKVTLRNDGTAPASFAITNNGTAVGSSVTVDAGKSVDVPVKLDEGANYDLKVTSGTREVISEKGVFTCTAPQPTATLSEKCSATDAGFVANLSNSAGTAPATFEVTQGGKVVATETVAAGASKSVAIAVAAGTKIDAAVSSGGQKVAELKSDHDCPIAKPSAVIAQVCGQGQVVTLRNDGNAPATFTITDAVSKFTKSVDVDGGKTDTVTVPVANDASYDIAVSSGGVAMASAKGVQACTVVTSTTVPVSSTVPASSTTQATSTVPASSTTLAGSTTVPASTTVPVIVQSLPTAVVTEDCAANALILALTNPTAAPVTVNVVSSIAGAASTILPVTIAANATAKLPIAVAPGATYAISVNTADGRAVGSFNGTRGTTCVPGSTIAGTTTLPPVATTVPPTATTLAPKVGGITVTVGGTQVTPVANAPRILPRTGSNTDSLIIFGLGLLGLGAVLLVVQDVMGSSRRKA